MSETNTEKLEKFIENVNLDTWNQRRNSEVLDAFVTGRLAALGEDSEILL